MDRKRCRGGSDGEAFSGSTGSWAALDGGVSRISARSCRICAFSALTRCSQATDSWRSAISCCCKAESTGLVLGEGVCMRTTQRTSLTYYEVGIPTTVRYRRGRTVNQQP